MDKNNYTFIELVSSLFAEFSQFPNDVCDFIGCQFALESNFGQSYLSRVNNNYCAMKNPLVRISSAVHAGDGNFKWAQYRSVHACVFDYLLCLQSHRPISTSYDTIEHFSNFIRKFYCPEKDYISRIEKIYNQFINLNN